MGDMAASWQAPDACNLPTAEQPLRVAEFDGLFERHVVLVERHGSTTASFVLRGPDGLEASVRDLTERESQCCSFFRFTVSRLPREESGCIRVHLAIEVPPARADVLRALTERAQSACAGGLHVG